MSSLIYKRYCKDFLTQYAKYDATKHTSSDEIKRIFSLFNYKEFNFYYKMFMQFHMDVKLESRWQYLGKTLFQQKVKQLAQ